MSSVQRSWCEIDEHSSYEAYRDFNQWLTDAEEAEETRKLLSVNGAAQPSKLAYVSDLNAFRQAFEVYKKDRFLRVLSRDHIQEVTGEEHWYEKNEARLDILVELIKQGTVIPFIGAGVSASCGFPTWAAHLKQQGCTAGIDSVEIERSIAAGEFEEIVGRIENSLTRDVFVHELRDVFSKRGTISASALLIADMFRDTVITTNYENTLEKAYDDGSGLEVQLITCADFSIKPEYDKLTLIKLHGDIGDPSECILSQSDYDKHYGQKGQVDLKADLPRLLEYYYTNNNLLFVGCSLLNDRTVQAMKAIKEKSGRKSFNHFSIEALPENKTRITKRNAELASIGISAIWYPAGQHEYVEEILQLLADEVNRIQILSMPKTNQ